MLGHEHIITLTGRAAVEPHWGKKPQRQKKEPCMLSMEKNRLLQVQGSFCQKKKKYVFYKKLYFPFEGVLYTYGCLFCVICCLLWFICVMVLF